MAKKIKNSELQDVQKSIKTINSLKQNLAQLELDKQGLISYIFTEQKKYADLQSDLREKYGNVDVNLETGEIREKSGTNKKN